METKAHAQIRLDLNYIGTRFTGWQKQPSKKSVQDELERVLAIILREEVKTLGASRTDTGVHAEHQVACLKPVNPPKKLSSLQRSINALISPDIRISEVQMVDDEFNPIRSAKAKLYRYRIWQGEVASCFAKPFVTQVQPGLNAKLMREASQLFIGEHDFQSFCAADATSRTTVRQIFDIKIREQGPLLEVYVLGNGFLKQMVRSMVGTLIEVGRGRRAPGSISAIIEGRDRCLAGPTAPADGLSLVKIFYSHLQEWTVETCIPKTSLSFAINHS